MQRPHHGLFFPQRGGPILTAASISEQLPDRACKGCRFFPLLHAERILQAGKRQRALLTVRPAGHQQARRFHRGQILALSNCAEFLRFFVNFIN